MQKHLAIASVPMQEWGALYGQEEALRVGTIYQDLNLPFFAAERDDGASVCAGQIKPDDGAQARGGQTGPENGAQARCGQTGPDNGAQARCGQTGPENGAQARCGQTGPDDGLQACCGQAAGRAEAAAQAAERENMMQKIQETGFVLDDLRLYMDTHPADDAGLTLLKGKLAERKTLLQAFAEKFYPLTGDAMADVYEKNPMTQCYCWQKGPMPWEGACV